MHKIYFNKEKNHTIIDVSGVKPVEQIKEEFGDHNYQIIEIDEEKEVHEIADGVLKKKAMEVQVVDEKENLIQGEMRKLAVESLKKQGKIKE